MKWCQVVAFVTFLGLGISHSFAQEKTRSLVDNEVLKTLHEASGQLRTLQTLQEKSASAEQSMMSTRQNYDNTAKKFNSEIIAAQKRTVSELNIATTTYADIKALIEESKTKQNEIKDFDAKNESLKTLHSQIIEQIRSEKYRAERSEQRSSDLAIQSTQLEVDFSKMQSDAANLSAEVEQERKTYDELKKRLDEKNAQRPRRRHPWYDPRSW